MRCVVILSCPSRRHPLVYLGRTHPKGRLGASEPRRRAPIDCLGPRPAAEGVNRQLHRRILQLLAGGAKDETIARMLGMSVRTCRRHIAEIMAKLDAVSRFQAGANAVRFGLPGADVGALQHP